LKGCSKRGMPEKEGYQGIGLVNVEPMAAIGEGVAIPERLEPLLVRLGPPFRGPRRSHQVDMVERESLPEAAQCMPSLSPSHFKTLTKPGANSEEQ